MNRIKVPSGSIQKFEDVFDNLQDSTEGNITNRTDRLFSNYGLVLDVQAGVIITTDFVVSLTDGNKKYTVNSGKALTTNGQHMDFVGFTSEIAADMDTDSYHLVKITYDSIGSVPKAAMNAFLFDQTGSTPQTTKNTVFTDSYTVSIVEVTPGWVITDSEVALAILKASSATTFYDTNFSFDGDTAVSGVIDKRDTNRLLLSKDLLDDTSLFVLDRDTSVTGKVSFGDDFYSGTDFYFDQSAGMLGLGLISPEARLHILETTAATDAKALIGAPTSANSILDLQVNSVSGSLSWDGTTLSSIISTTSIMDITATGTAVTGQLSGTTITSPAITSTGTLSVSGVTNINNTLYSDSTNGRIGFGTSAPDVLVHVKSATVPSVRMEASTDTDTIDPKIQFYTGATSTHRFTMGVDHSVNYFKISRNATFNTPDFVVTSEGKVGFGVAVPGEKVEIDGTLALNNNPSIKLNPTDTVQIGEVLVQGTDSYSISAGAAALPGSRHGFAIKNDSNDTYVITADQNGKVGINNYNPSQELDVTGTASFSVGMVTPAAIITEATITTLNTTNFNITNSTITNANATALNWKANSNDTEYIAGVDSAGRVTIGASSENAVDILRVAGDARIYGANKSLIFSADTTTDTFKWNINSSELSLIGGSTGTYMTAKTDGTMEISSLVVDKLTLNDSTSVLDIGSATMTVGTLSAAVLNADNAGFSNLTISGLFTVSGLTMLGNGSNVLLSGIGSSDLKVGVGSLSYPLGRSVSLSDEEPTQLANFRIYDVMPTENPQENDGYVWMKWNWDQLNVSSTSGSEITVTASGFTGEAFSPAEADLVGKQFYFTNSGNKYPITAYNTGTKVATVTGTVTAETTTSSFPGRIIDRYITNYQLTASNSARMERRTIIDLSSAYVDEPSYVMKLELGKSYYLAIQSRNKDYTNTEITMTQGSYDPDHSAGGQANTNYTSPYAHTLPNISPVGSIELTGTPYGFNVDITGWENILDIEDTAHEFEIAFSTASGINFDDYTTTQHIISSDRLKSISINNPSRIYLGVRPLQNKQAVYAAIYSNIAAGGGGVAPGENVLCQMPADIVVYSGLITAENTLDDDYDMDTYDDEGNLAMFGYNQLLGETAEVRVGSGASIRGFYQVVRNRATYSNA